MRGRLALVWHHGRSKRTKEDVRKDERKRGRTRADLRLTFICWWEAPTPTPNCPSRCRTSRITWLCCVLPLHFRRTSFQSSQPVSTDVTTHKSTPSRRRKILLHSSQRGCLWLLASSGPPPNPFGLVNDCMCAAVRGEGESRCNLSLWQRCKSELRSETESGILSQKICMITVKSHDT